jgi:hypothetical protein
MCAPGVLVSSHAVGGSRVSAPQAPGSAPAEREVRWHRDRLNDLKRWPNCRPGTRTPYGYAKGASPEWGPLPALHTAVRRRAGRGAPRIAGASWHEGGDSRTGAHGGQSTLDRRNRADAAPFASTEQRRLPPAAPSGPLPDGYAVRQWRSGGVRQLRLQRMTVAVCCLGRAPVHRP